MAIELRDKPKSELVAGYTRLKATMAKHKVVEKTKAVARRATNTAVAAGAGYGVGALRSKFGVGAHKDIYIPGTDIEADLVTGVLCSGLGLTGMAEEYSDTLCSFGGGVMSAYLAIKAFNNGPDLRDDND